jgi:serine/threonine-protein kinase RsbW
MPSRYDLSFSATPAGFQQAADDVRRRLDGSGLPTRLRYNIELVFEEVVTNILRHNTPAGHGSDIEASLEIGSARAVLTFEDSGAPFDPRQQPDPAQPQSLDDAKAGGLGLLLVRKASERVDYERTPGQRNRLTVTLAA